MRETLILKDFKGDAAEVNDGNVLIRSPLVYPVNCLRVSSNDASLALLPKEEVESLVIRSILQTRNEVFKLSIEWPLPLLVVSAWNHLFILSPNGPITSCMSKNVGESLVE